MNSVQLIGRLTHPPRAASADSGRSVTTFRVAVDRPGRDDADFVTVKTWGRLAETTAEYLERGRCVAVEGCLEHSEWTADDGQRRERLTVVADRVTFLDAPTTRTASPAPTARSPRESAASSSS